MYKTIEEINALQKEYDNNTIKLTEKEKLKINPKIAYEVLEIDINKSIPFEKLRSLKETYGELSKLSTQVPTSNLMWDFLFFTDSSYFRPAAILFEQSLEDVKRSKLKPAYTRAIPGTKAYDDFWSTELDRIINGFEPIIDGKPCGLRISGEFYFYLNYGWIKLVDFDPITGEHIRDKSGFPKFLAMDYYYFKELEARENPKLYGLSNNFKQSLCVAKGRRLGFSYKAGAGAVWVTAFRNKAKVLIASAEGSDAVLCFQKAMDVIEHISAYTPFGREEIGEPSTNGGWKAIPSTNKKDQGKFVFGFVNTKNNTNRKGRLSEISTVSLHNKPDAASGTGLSRLYMEESGKVDDLNSAWVFSRESLKVGTSYRDGIAIIFGTGGEMIAESGKKGSSRDFSILFNKPEANSLAAYDNIYELKHSQQKCGYFVPSMWYRPGESIILDGKRYLPVDHNGNAFFWVAELIINKERKLLAPPNGKKADYERSLTQICKTPSEAFLITKGSRFQIEDLINRQSNILLRKGGFTLNRMPGELIEDANGVRFVPNIKLQPITTMNVDISDREGCLLLYEEPKFKEGKIPDGAYIISVDPIGINSSTGKSLVSIIVYKTNKYSYLFGEEKIVATYFGRVKINPQEYTHRLLLKLSKFYNAKITFENDRDGGIPQFFAMTNNLHRILEVPAMTLEKFIPNSKTRYRELGHSMSSSAHKEVGEMLIYEWLERRGSKKVYYDSESGQSITQEGIRNLDRLENELLIEQLINYDRSGNYDSVSALMGIMVQLNERYEFEKDIYPFQEESDGELLKFFNKKYKTR